MKLRIDLSKLKSDPLHWISIVLYMLLVAEIAYFVNRFVEVPEAGIQTHVSFSRLSGIVTPSAFAARVRMLQAIDRFRGVQQTKKWGWEVCEAPVALVIFCVVTPAMLAWGIFARRKIRQSGVLTGFPVRTALAISVGGFLCLALGADGLLGTAQRLSWYQVLRKDNQRAFGQNALISDLNLVATRAQVFYYLPMDLGGGGRSWLNESGSPNFVLRNFEPVNPFLGSTMEPMTLQRPNRFIAEVPARDSLIIWGISPEEGYNVTGEFQNKDGERGKFQCRMIVTPRDKSLSFEN